MIDKPDTTVTNYHKLKNKYLVDVCIPTYNEKGYIERTLLNLTDQDIYKKGMIHIVIGDYKDELNADDNYLSNLCRKYEHTTYVPVFQKGIAAARNIIIRDGSLTNIIMNFDADSVFNRTDAVEKMIHPILRGEAKITNCEVMMYDFEKKEPVIKPIRNFYDFGLAMATPLEKLVFARGPGLTVDKQAFYDVGGFRMVPAAEDYYLSFDICMAYGMISKRFIDDVKILTSDRRAKAFEEHGFKAVDYNKSYYR